MKNIRRTVIITLVLIFCIAVIISAAVATSVKNINVSYLDETGAYTDAYGETIANLEELKGGNIMLADENDVLSCISDATRIKLISFGKTYPCSLDIVIAERVETFYCEIDEVCYVYDENGEYMYTSANIVSGSQSEGYVLAETHDLSPNVIIDSGLTQAERTFLAEACSVFKSNFGVLRQLVKSVAREVTPESENLIFMLRSGLKIEISGCESLAEEKIAAAFSKFETLSDGQKTSGKIRAYAQESAPEIVRCVYTP